MSRFEGLSERNRVLPAVMVGVGISVFTLLAQLFRSATYFGVAWLQGAGYQPNVLSALLSSQFLLITLAFCVGVVAWLWLFAPLSAELRLGSVIARSLLAVVAGAVVTLVVSFCIGLQSWLANADFFSNSMSQAADSFIRDGGNAIATALSTTLGVAVDVLPLTVLAVVLTWSWLVRHPAPEREVVASVEV